MTKGGTREIELRLQKGGKATGEFVWTISSKAFTRLILSGLYKTANPSTAPDTAGVFASRRI